VGAGLFDKAPQPIMLEANTNREEAFKTLFLNENMLARDQNKPYVGPTRPVAMASVKLQSNTATSASSTSATRGRPSTSIGECWRGRFLCPAGHSYLSNSPKTSAHAALAP
jgi:hypothetical protein